MCDSSSVEQTTWSRWFLDAIRKIRSQKQRPSAERICHAIRQHHNYHEDVITEHLELSVREGAVLKVFNKGQSSYKDPGGMQSRRLRIDGKADLSKVIAKAVRELGERDGSTLKNIEKYLKQSHTVDMISPDVDLRQVLRMSLKRAVAKGTIVQEGKHYKSGDFHSPGGTPGTPKKKADGATPKSKSSPDAADALKVRWHNLCLLAMFTFVAEPARNIFVLWFVLSKHNSSSVCVNSDQQIL